MWEPLGLYSKFILKQPTLLVGSNAILGLKNYPCSRIAIIHGKGLSEELKTIIKKATGAFDLKFIKKSWSGEPIVEELSATIHELEEFKPDTIIAIGGGAVIDGSKMARLYYEFPFFDIQTTKFTHLEWKTKFIAIPTTVGSGSEISSAAVLINKKENTKEVVVSHSLIPEIVILDPLYIKGSPKNIILSSSIDAIAHITEGYVSVVENIIAENYAEKGLQNIYEVLSKNDEYSLQDISKLQLAGYLGGLVQNHCIVGAAHAIAHQLGGYRFGHAEAVAMLLPHVITANAQNKQTLEKYDRLSTRSHIGTTTNLINFIKEIKGQIDNKGKENEMKTLISKLIDDSIFINHIQKDKGGKGNPTPLTEDFIKSILNTLL